MNLDTQNLPPEVAAYIRSLTAAGTEEATAGAGEAVTGKTAGEDAVPE